MIKSADKKSGVEIKLVENEFFCNINYNDIGCNYEPISLVHSKDYFECIPKKKSKKTLMCFKEYFECIPKKKSKKTLMCFKDYFEYMPRRIVKRPAYCQVVIDCKENESETIQILSKDESNQT